MARRVLADFDAEILLALGNRTDITSGMRAQLLHDALLWCCKTYRHPEIEATTTGSIAPAAEVVSSIVATDIWFPTFVFDTTNNRELDPRDLNYIERQRKSPGNPSCYHWFGQTFYVDRKPTTAVAVKIFYHLEPPEIVTSPIIDRAYDVI